MAAKTVLITGSNRGIGLAFATHYKREGWQVIGCARDVQAATDVRHPAMIHERMSTNYRSICILAPLS
jgi:NAD(P)-dependent dehydrogenase (short-subunit alcohol dehydrogenase family)